MSPRSPLPVATRRAAWDRLWRILLAPPNSRTERVGPHSDEDHAEGQPPVSAAQ